MRNAWKRVLTLTLALALAVVLAAPALAVVPDRPENQYVLDQAGVLSEETEQEIISQNQKLFQETGAQIVVVAVDFLDGEEIDDYAYSLFNTWGIGSVERNNGLLLLMAIAEDNYFAASRLDEDAASAAEGGAQAAGKAAADHAGDICLPTRGTLTYYNTVREELTEAFSRLPADHSLEETFPQSRWVKKEGALLGIVYEAGLPRYLCVAVPAGTDPPACMRGRAVFVPRSPFSEEEGFWVIFQDADTGEYVTVSDS